MLDSQTQTKFKIVDGSGKVLGIKSSKLLADAYVDSLGLNESDRSDISIIPITESGQQMLFG